MNRIRAFAILGHALTRAGVAGAGEAEAPRVEVGAEAGVVSRPSTEDGVQYRPGVAAGGHARVEPLTWLGARLAARFEWSEATVSEGALAPGVRFRDVPLRRIVLSATAEPTWSPATGLDLWVGLGIGWGRTTAERLRPEDAEAPSLPPRSAVFLEAPLSLGARYAVVPSWVTVSLMGAASLLAEQSGTLFEDLRTPDASGKLVRISGFPELGASWSVLAGVGVLL